MHTENSATVSFTMKKVLWALSILFIALTIQAADVPQIHGTWIPVKAELGGQPLPEAVLKTITLKLNGGKYDVSVAGAPDKGTYTLDVSSNPKSMVIKGTDGPNKGKTIPAIYELETDELRICYDLSGNQRPAGFKSIAGTRLYLVTYHRKKD